MYTWVLSTSMLAKRPVWKTEASPNKIFEVFSRKLLLPKHWVNSEINCTNMEIFYPLFLYHHSKKTRVWVHLFYSRASGLRTMLTWQRGWLSELSVEHLHRKWRPRLFSLISFQIDSVLQDKRSLDRVSNQPLFLKHTGPASSVASPPHNTQSCSSLLQAVKKIAPWESTATRCQATSSAGTGFQSTDRK